MCLRREYRPAQEVGGDFFQILPDGHGGVLILLGDVTGKGLQAGMQVALIVGVPFAPSWKRAMSRRSCSRH